MKTIVVLSLALLLLAVTGYVTIHFWSYIFARTVVGVITDVQRVTTSSAPAAEGAAPLAAQEASAYAIAIKEKSGEIATASSEDSQWTLARPGQCAEAKYYPYPPWVLDKSGTFYGARLLKLYVCEEGKLIQPTPGDSDKVAEPPTDSSP